MASDGIMHRAYYFIFIPRHWGLYYWCCHRGMYYIYIYRRYDTVSSVFIVDSVVELYYYSIAGISYTTCSSGVVITVDVLASLATVSIELSTIG